MAAKNKMAAIRRQLLVQKHKNSKKHKRAKKCTCAPAISNAYLSIIHRMNARAARLSSKFVSSQFINFQTNAFRNNKENNSHNSHYSTITINNQSWLYSIQRISLFVARHESKLQHIYTSEETLEIVLKQKYIIQLVQ